MGPSSETRHQRPVAGVAVLCGCYRIETGRNSRWSVNVCNWSSHACPSNIK
ncbi:hypothetical protein Bpfe_006204, partial [Biomphalaria pfeifferi]